MALTAANRSRLHATLACTITGLLWWRTRGITFAVIWIVALILLALACFNPRGYAPVQRLLDSFARILSATVTWVVLGLVYFLVFTPLRVWNRMLGRDPLHVRGPRKSSFLQNVSANSFGRFERQY